MRTFIAIELPNQIRTQINQHQQSLARVLNEPPIRWVKPDSIHLTLKFLGEISRQKADRIGTELSLQVGRYDPVKVLVGGMGCFPSFNRPRVIWIGLDDQSGVLEELQANLDRWLQRLGFQPEKRGFSPHLTIGRVQRHVDNRQRRELGKKIQDYQVPDLGNFLVESIHLFQSDLKPTGAVYRRLAKAELGVDHE